MSLLKINKKAVDNVDGMVLFQHSIALQEPLGTPTVFISDTDIPDDASSFLVYLSARLCVNIRNSF
ncbi:MAG: hypothetical protein ACRBCK_01345 [Alphaproteobacteria bacterium]